jgi:hypothetical protein
VGGEFNPEEIKCTGSNWLALKMQASDWEAFVRLDRNHFSRDGASITKGI